MYSFCKITTSSERRRDWDFLLFISKQELEPKEEKLKESCTTPLLFPAQVCIYSRIPQTNLKAKKSISLQITYISRVLLD
jgi:hypothetical protein